MTDMKQTQSAWHILKEVYKYPAKGFSLKRVAASCERQCEMVSVVFRQVFLQGVNISYRHEM